MPLHTRHRVIEAVLNKILVLHNKPKAAVHLTHKLMGEGEEEEEKEEEEKEMEEEKGEERGGGGGIEG